MLQKPQDIYTFGPFTLNVTTSVFAFGGQEIQLEPKTFATLAFFVLHPGERLSRQQIMQAVWENVHVGSNSVDQKICDIRKVFSQYDSPSHKYIETTPKRGWQFKAQVARQPESPPAEEPLVAEPPQETVPAAALSQVFAGQSSSRLFWIVVLAVAAISAAVMVAARGLSRANVEPQAGTLRRLTEDGRPKSGPLVSDGSYVYFSERTVDAESGPGLLAAVPAGGGSVLFPANPVDPAALILDVARNTGDVLYGRWIAEAGFSLVVWRQKQHRLERDAGSRAEPRMSPDGRSIASVSGLDQTAAIIIQDLADPPNIRRIPVKGRLGTPAWSPDGSRIRFSAADSVSETSVFWEVRRDGSDLHRLTLVSKPGFYLRDGCWSADGRYFIYSETSTGVSSLWIQREQDAMGQQQRVRLTDAGWSFDLPVQAPLGNTVFARGSISKNGLERYDVNLGKFTVFWEDVPAADVSFSNDGAWAAYRSWTDDTVWVSRHDGSERRQLTQTPLHAYQPHWSPDGKQIAFMGQAPNQPSRIFLVGASGGQPHAVKPVDSLEQGVPSWSGDGRYLVFGELRQRRSDDDMLIRLLELKTGKETVLPGSKAKWTPRWSPDGRYIVATATDGGSLALFDCARRRWTPLVTAPGIDDPVWSLDSRFVHFSLLTGGDGGRALFRVRIADAHLERLAPYPPSQIRWSGVSPDGSPLVLNSTRIEDIYAINFK